MLSEPIALKARQKYSFSGLLSPFTADTFLVPLQIQLVHFGFIENVSCYKPLKHLQTLYLESADFDIPPTVLKLLKSMQVMKFQEKNVHTGPIIWVRKAELQC